MYTTMQNVVLMPNKTKQNERLSSCVVKFNFLRQTNFRQSSLFKIDGQVVSNSTQFAISGLNSSRTFEVYSDGMKSFN
jgi:hypothetical protein